MTRLPPDHETAVQRLNELITLQGDPPHYMEQEVGYLYGLRDALRIIEGRPLLWSGFGLDPSDTSADEIDPSPEAAARRTALCSPACAEAHTRTAPCFLASERFLTPEPENP